MILDEPNTVRTVRQQVKHENLVGYIAAHEPDFEFANFSVEELVDLAARFDEEEGHSGEAIRSATWADITNGRMSADRYREISLRGRDLKGEAWGRALARHAMSHPTGSDGDRRPFIKTVEAVLRSRTVRYDFQKAA